MKCEIHVKSPNPHHLTPMDFVEILAGECIHQEMKILKILSPYRLVNETRVIVLVEVGM